MEHPGFYRRAGPIALEQIAGATESTLADGADGRLEILDVAPLAEAASGHISFLENTKYLRQFEKTKAGACFTAAEFAGQAPEGTAVLVAGHPYRSFALALGLFYPEARFSRTPGTEGWAESGGVHPDARLEPGVVVEPGAVVGAEAVIGSGTRISAGAIIGYRVHIGRDCYVGPGANVMHTLAGNRVIIHSGAGVGQDGFGFAMGPQGHLKVPQIGRVVIQDDVEIGANSTIDRGAMRDTIIGEGTKIDNLVQIGHNVVIGRHCVIVANVGISGSTQLGDFVVLGGKVGVAGHVKIGDGAQLAGDANVTKDVPPGVTWGGYPAKPVGLWRREVAALKRLATADSSRRKKRD